MWRDRIRYRRRLENRGSGRQSLGKSRDLVKLTKLLFIGVILLAIFIFIGLPLLSLTLPSPDKVVRTQGFSTQILDRNGQLLYDIYANQNRQPVALNDIPVYLRQATIAIEDKNFYSHGGFDPVGILRGFLKLFTTGRAEGGSTLTQQLVKNALLTSDRSLIRKLKELVLSIEIERKYSKDEILQMYLNEVPYGGTAWGVGAAAETYFGKEVKDLDLVECAILAGMPQSPSTYSPYSSTPRAYIGRTLDVLKAMQANGYITADQEKAAVAEVPNVTFQAKGAGLNAPHFVQYVEKILTDRYGQAAVEQGGLKVTTTLDLNLQQQAQKIVTDEIAQVEKQHITNGAAIVLDPETGEILAMIGSRDFSAQDVGQYNVTTALRQPGSSFKPFTYVTALKKGYTAATLLMDVPTDFPGGANQPPYQPVNYDGKFVGPIQMRFALAESRNIPAVKMLAMVGIKDVLQTATDMGITTLPPTADTLNKVGLSLTLGGGEVRLIDMADAYSAFVNQGRRVDPVAILKVIDANGKVLEEDHPEKGKQVITEQQAFIIDSMLSDDPARASEFGPHSYLYVPGYDVMVKTGTTNDKRDNWTIGGNDNAIVGVWVGNNDNSPMYNVASGISGASPIWHNIVLAALKDKPKVTFQVPQDVTQMDVDSVSGYPAHDGFPTRQEYFIKGTEPQGPDLVHVLLKLCNSDGKLANPSDIAANNYHSQEFFEFKEEDPTAPSGGPNKWQEGILNWLNTQSDARYHPPTDYCGSSNPLDVEFVSPTDKTSNMSTTSDTTVNFTANSNSAIAEASVKVDGNQKCSYNNGSNNYTCNIGVLSSGVHSLEADATDANNHSSNRVITVGAGVAWDYSTPAPSPTP